MRKTDSFSFPIGALALVVVLSGCQSAQKQVQAPEAKVASPADLDVSIERMEKSPILALFSDWSEKASTPGHVPRTDAERYFLSYSRKLGEHCAAAVVAGHRDPQAIMSEAKKHGEIEQMYLMQALLNIKFSADDIAFAIFCLEAGFEQIELPKRIQAMAREVHKD